MQIERRVSNEQQGQIGLLQRGKDIGGSENRATVNHEPLDMGVGVGYVGTKSDQPAGDFGGR
jgi:hypothetical protein